MGQPLVHSQRLSSSCMSFYLLFLVRVNKGWLPTLNPLPPAGVFLVWVGLHGLVPLGQVVCIL